MKKILFTLALVLSLAFVANAQNVEKSRLFNNVYFGVDGGIVSALDQPDFNSYFKTAVPTFGAELGKYITPVFGLSVAGQGMFDLANKDILAVNTVGNLKFNISNWFGGYKGQPRVFEFVVVPGIGWIHRFDNQADPNYITYNTGCEFNFNLGPKKAWQLGLHPSVVWNIADGTGMGFKMSKADLRIAGGITYKFGYKNSKGERTHNFTIVENGISVEEYNDLLAKYDELLNTKPDTVVVENTIIEENTVVEVAMVDLIVSFEKGSSEVSNIRKEQIVSFAKIVDEKDVVKVVGSADTATGSKEFNDKLATERAMVVARILKDNGVNNIETVINLDVDSNPSASRCAIIRIVE